MGGGSPWALRLALMSIMTGPDGNMFVAWISRVLFGLAGAALIAFAVALVDYGIMGVVKPAQRLDFAMLDAIGYVVISIACSTSPSI
jgi:hypothetical protein